jgi:hypothetical protein
MSSAPTPIHSMLSVLGDQAGDRPALLELLGRHRGEAAHAGPPRWSHVGHQPEVSVVHQIGDQHLVDRFQGDGIDGRAGDFPDCGDLASS